MIKNKTLAAALPAATMLASPINGWPTRHLA
jgi:hypothetical protein